uniref:hypothetical protein n=1 Tax=Escherichia coli TaxID=562 RepID=UPI0011625F87|nr:Uncharacterised protein [Escherichia coli]
MSTGNCHGITEPIIPAVLGKKIIIENLLYPLGVTGSVTLDCSGREALDDLVRPFYLLEGRNVPDFRKQHRGAVW